MRAPTSVLVSLFLLGAASDARAVQCQSGKLLATPVTDPLARTVALSGSLALVGNPHDGERGVDAGAAYLFDLTTGQMVAKLLASDAAPHDQFGGAVAMQGTTALIGAAGRSAQRGAAYVFDLTTGTELGILEAEDGQAGDGFGRSVALDGVHLLVGSPHDGASHHGSAYLFDLPSLTQRTKLRASDGANDDELGTEVAVAGSTLLVAAPGDDDGGSSAGAVVLFDAVTGAELAKLVASDGHTADGFGFALAAAGNLAVVGAPFADIGSDGNAGAAYVFDLSTGTELAKLVATEVDLGATFGRAVGTDGVTVVVGAPNQDDGESATGSAELFTAAGLPLGPLLTNDRAPSDGFGWRVAVDGAVVLALVLNDDDLGENTGSILVFETNCTPIGTSYCGPAVPNSSGVPGVAEASGSAEVHWNCVRLGARDLPVDQFGLFLTSRTQGFVQNPGGSQGDLCLGGQIGRFVDSLQSSGPDGRIEHLVDLAHMPPPVQQQVLAGETWNFTAWYRDQNPSATSNFTDAVGVLFL